MPKTKTLAYQPRKNISFLTIVTLLFLYLIVGLGQSLAKVNDFDDAQDEGLNFRNFGDFSLTDLQAFQPTEIFSGNRTEQYGRAIAVAMPKTENLNSVPLIMAYRTPNQGYAIEFFSFTAPDKLERSRKLGDSSSYPDPNLESCYYDPWDPSAPLSVHQTAIFIATRNQKWGNMTLCLMPMAIVLTLLLIMPGSLL